MTAQANRIGVDGNRQRGDPVAPAGRRGTALAGAAWAHGQMGQGWWLFVLLLLAPDLSMLGYLRDARTGAAIHNLGHTCLAPLALLALGWAAALPPVMTVALTGLLTSAWTGRWATG